MITADDTTLALPDNIAFPDWLDVGRNLANQKRHIDWLIGDWITFGRQRFPEQVELAIDQFGDRNHIKRIEKTVLAFPAHLRCSELSFDHHAHVADMPVQEALPLLKMAEAQNLDAKTLRVQAMLRKVEIGQIIPREDDPDDDMLLAMVRAWNRSPRDVRSEFLEMAQGTSCGLIDFGG
ncbi:MAG: hypothetical protein B7Y36_19005 [Novosphingobium sp. 28-62-57]|nr:MAG: hypothetical protein B7Y36_19005 [Novosphingobium sp. 28-62-57]OZA30509.1 MAG: hypothetical protein B7X92_15935 [Novosphingobium sp. 17-62-9]